MKSCYRGKCVATGLWYYGDRLVTKDGVFIRFNPGERGSIRELGLAYIDGVGMLVKVVPDTVSQYIRREDEKGHCIYEGDIWEYDERNVYLVEYDESYVGYAPFVCDDGCGCCSSGNTGKEPTTGRVIGNKWDNPALVPDP